MFNAFNLYHQRLAITQETSDALDVYLYYGGVVYFSRNDIYVKIEITKYIFFVRKYYFNTLVILAN